MRHHCLCVVTRFSTFLMEPVPTGRGLGLDRVMLALLCLYTDPRMLVLVINVPETDLGLLMEELSGFSHCHPPVAVTTDQTGAERKKLYLRGGMSRLAWRKQRTSACT